MLESSKIQTSILLAESAVFNDQESGNSDASLVWLYPAAPLSLKGSAT